MATDQYGDRQTFSSAFLRSFVRPRKKRETRRTGEMASFSSPRDTCAVAGPFVTDANEAVCQLTMKILRQSGACFSKHRHSPSHDILGTIVDRNLSE